MNIVCFSDKPPHLAELIAGARAANTGGKVHAVTTGGDAKDLIARGADVVHVLKAPDNHPATLCAAVVKVAQGASAQAVLIGATKRGKAFAGMVAEKLAAPYAAEVSGFGFENGKPWARRMLLSGNTNGRLQYDAASLVLTAAPKVWEAAAPDAGRSGETQDLQVESGSKATLVQVHKTEHGGVNLGSAKVVVGAGRGVKKKEDLKMLEDLAASMGGALGCSRPLAADLKWLGEEHWIGLSGNEIKPRLYIACGVSGQIQHLTGCRGSKTIVAINTDEDAPIFEHADYGIVGDIYDVVPKLTEFIRTKYK